MPPKLTEADVLFELFLPMLCESKAEAMAHFKGEIYFFMRAEEPRSWTLKGGKKPWLKRGPGERLPDVVVTVTEDLVRDLVQGREPDLEEAVRDGRLGMKGNIEILQAFDMTLADVKRALDVVLRR